MSNIFLAIFLLSTFSLQFKSLSNEMNSINAIYTKIDLPKSDSVCLDNGPCILPRLDYGNDYHLDAYCLFKEYGGVTPCN